MMIACGISSKVLFLCVLSIYHDKLLEHGIITWAGGEGLLVKGLYKR